MNTLIAPCYYPAFSCIADRCRHNCCIGWEIDIDEETYRAYQALEGSIGKRMNSAISLQGGIPHFKLDSKERCPFLSKDGLCDIICELGKEALCNICTDHPRYRNYYSNHTEIGLGLCCEEAARLILTTSDKIALIPINQQSKFKPGKEEQLLLDFRDELFEIMQDRANSIGVRLTAAAKRSNLELDGPKKVLEIIKNTERMDPSFDPLLIHLRIDQWPSFEEEAWQLPMEQLSVYFLFRHLPEALRDGLLQERVAFALLSPLIIGTIAKSRMKNGKFSLDLLLETARLYSAEIEYSDENIQTILSNLQLT